MERRVPGDAGGRGTTADDPAADDDGADRHLRAAAGGVLDANRFADATAVGHRRGRQHDLDAVPDAVPDAGAVHVLRAPRSALGVEWDGPLREERTRIQSRSG